MRTAYVLSWTPEQGEDLFLILVDDSTIASVELERGDFSTPPEVEAISLHDYERGLSGINRIQLAVALDLARRDLSAKS